MKICKKRDGLVESISDFKFIPLDSFNFIAMNIYNTKKKSNIINAEQMFQFTKNRPTKKQLQLGRYARKRTPPPCT